MKYTFKKLFEHTLVSKSGDFGFKKMSIAEYRNPEAVNFKFNLKALGLTSDAYSIAVTSCAAGIESEKSNAVLYVC
jgi:hypothetical protein